MRHSNLLLGYYIIKIDFYQFWSVNVYRFILNIYCCNLTYINALLLFKKFRRYYEVIPLLKFISINIYHAFLNIFRYIIVRKICKILIQDHRVYVYTHTHTLTPTPTLTLTLTIRKRIFFYDIN